MTPYSPKTVEMVARRMWKSYKAKADSFGWNIVEWHKAPKNSKEIMRALARFRLDEIGGVLENEMRRGFHNRRNDCGVFKPCEHCAGKGETV